MLYGRCEAETAVATHERMGAGAFLAASRLGLAEVLALRDNPRAGALVERVIDADRAFGLPLLGARAEELRRTVPP